MVKRFSGGLLSPRVPGVSLSSASGMWSLVDVSQNRSNVAWPNGVIEYLPIDIFMAAGGGAGGPFVGAGGGAGGVLIGSLQFRPTIGTYTIYIGAGAASGAEGTNGSNTAIAFGGANIYTAIGGGGAYSMSEGIAIAGNAGGSGGGGGGSRGGVSAGGNALQTSQIALSGTTRNTLIGYGYPGGTGTASGDPVQPGGGGGATQTGGNGTPNPASGGTYAGYGGDGIYNNYRTGTNIGYAGGGAGTSYSFYDAVVIPTNKRHLYGGGHTGTSANLDAVVNTGGGGGGGGFPPFYTAAIGIGAGGSGIVIIRYHTNFITATGGIVSNYTLGGIPITAHTFIESNTFVITDVSWPVAKTTSVEYLVVAGGGGGQAGGGGAGGLLTNSVTVAAGTTYGITVGAGGAKKTPNQNSIAAGSGNNSNIFGSGFATITAAGGAGGSDNGYNGANGGSGAGGGFSGSGTTVGGLGNIPATTPSQGNNGGGNGGYTGNPYPAGGGGGAGAVGNTAPSGSVAGNGGAGVASSITGTLTTYAGGGAGGTYGGGTGGTGGAGGGGNAGTDGTINTGGGGGGGQGAQGNGGTGIVVIRYPDSFAPATTTGSPNVIYSGGYVSYRFWQSGTIVF